MRYVEESQLSFSQISCLSPLAAPCTTVAQRKEQMPRIEFQFSENEKTRNYKQKYKYKQEKRANAEKARIEFQCTEKTSNARRLVYGDHTKVEFGPNIIFWKRGFAATQSRPIPKFLLYFIISLEHGLFTLENII